jgi:hypothetical protein
MISSYDIFPVLDAVRPDKPRFLIISPAADHIIKMVFLDIYASSQDNNIVRHAAFVVIPGQRLDFINSGLLDFFLPDLGESGVDKVHQKLDIIF